MLATQIEVSDGTLNIINVGIEFFEQDDISVSLDQAEFPLLLGVDYQWTSTTIIQFLDTVNSPGGLVPNGVQVIVRRDTKNDSMYNVYDGGAPFSRLTLDENFEQLLRLSQEFSEGLGLDGLQNHLNMNGYRITNLGDPVEPDDAVNLQTVDAKHDLSLRVPDSEGFVNELPSALARANLVLGFNAAGEPVVVPTGEDSATALALALASPTGATLVHRGGDTIDDDLTALETRATDAEAAIVALDNRTDATEADIAALEANVLAGQIADQNQLNQLNAAMTKAHTSVNGFLIGNNPWGVRCLNILGDSISFGANAQDIERDSWVGILKKMLNIEYGSGNLGLLNIVAQSSNSEGTYQQYFSTSSSQTGTWTALAGAAAAHIGMGFALQSTVATSSQNLQAPLSQRYLRVWYDGTVTGSFEVVINSVVVQTITTTGAGTGNDRGAALELATLVAANRGTVQFTLRHVSGTIRLTGLEFTNDTTGNSFRVHNFSRDGRAGQFVSQAVINTMAAGAFGMVWALGTNDVPGLDETTLAAYTQRIDWIIAAAAANRTKVVFMDFLYDQVYDHPLRVQLRRGATSIPNAILIDVEQLWTVQGAQFSEADRNSRGLAFGVHPEELGHRLVAETVAQRLGLSVTSKRSAIRRDPIWKALDINASGLNNVSGIPGRFTGYRIGERAIEIIVDLTTVPAVQTTIGTIPAADFQAFAGANFKSNPDSTGKNGLFTIASNGAVVYRPDPTITGTPIACTLYASIPYHDASFWP